MSKIAVALLCVLFIILLVVLDKHYYYALDQQYEFTKWVLKQYCSKGAYP